MYPHAPIYCETGHPWLGMAEPVNTITNAAIILAAYFAYRYVKKSKVGFSADLVLLIFLLAACGIGSTLWHGLRTWWALQLDWIPGVLYLIVFATLWFRRLLGWLYGLLGVAGMMAVTIMAVVLSWHTLGAVQPTPSSFRFVPGFVSLTIFALGLVTVTARKYGQGAASLGAVILMFAVAAAVFRSIDLLMCDLIPFGTHFLWHICLSTAAYLGIVLMVRMKKKNLPSP